MAATRALPLAPTVAGNWTRGRPSAEEEELRRENGGGGLSAGGVLRETCKIPVAGVSGAGPPVLKSEGGLILEKERDCM